MADQVTAMARKRPQAVGDDRLGRRRDVPLRLVLPPSQRRLPRPHDRPGAAGLRRADHDRGQPRSGSRRSSRPTARAASPSASGGCATTARARRARGCAGSSSARSGTPPAACPSTSTCAAASSARAPCRAPPRATRSRCGARAEPRPSGPTSGPRPSSSGTTTTRPHRRGGSPPRSTTSRIVGPSLRKAMVPVLRRRSSPAPVNAATVRASEPVSATTWSTVVAPLGWSGRRRVAASPGRTSGSPSGTPRYPLRAARMPPPRPVSRSRASPSTTSPAASGANPSRAHAAGASPSSISAAPTPSSRRGRTPGGRARPTSPRRRRRGRRARSARRRRSARRSARAAAARRRGRWWRT